MNIIVCGAGQVGYHIARQLSSEGHNITVVDSSPENIRRVDDALDVRSVEGFASLPHVLDRANAAEADMLIAVTQADEVNMVACQVAHSLFNVPVKIARVRNQEYLQPIWADLFSRDHMPIDVIISPEKEVARTIARDLAVPGAFDAIPAVDGKVQIIGVHCNEDCPVLHTPLRQLSGVFPDIGIIVIGIIRDGQTVRPTSSEQMLAGDDVYFISDSEHVERTLRLFGHEEGRARHIIVMGGGNVGLFLAEQVLQDHPGVTIRVIEARKERADFLSGTLQPKGVTVILGNGLEREILEEAGVARTEAVIAVTDDDESNILGSLLAKRHGAQRAMALVNNTTYSTLITSVGVDAVIGPRAITASTILQHVRRGLIRNVHSLGENLGEVLEVDILETSSLIDRAIADIDLPEGALFGAIVRRGRVLKPRGETVVEKGDRVVFFAPPHAVQSIAQLFAVRLEYF